jgi:hypothetical protein
MIFLIFLKIVDFFEEVGPCRIKELRGSADHGMAIAGLADSSSVNLLSYLTKNVRWSRNSSEFPKIIWNQQMIRYIR